MPALTLGIDLGTTATKAVLFDPDAGLVAQGSLPVALHSAHPGWAESDPAEWWRNLCRLVPALLEQASARANHVACVAASGMVPAVVLVDERGESLGPAALQNDARATAEIELLQRRLDGIDLLPRTGSPLSQQSVAPTLLWMQTHAQERWTNARWVVGSYDWLAIKLGATPCTERNWAMESGLYELGGLADASNLTAEHVDDVLEAATIPASRLPPVRASGQLIGAVSPSAARETGLAPGIPIVTGGADHVLSAYAAGLTSPGEWLIKIGGGGDILVVTEKIFIDRRLYLDAHPEPGRWLPNGCMATSGSLLRWLQHLLGNADIAALEREAQARPAGQIICLPYLLGEKSPLHDPMLRGAFVGLHLGHERGDLVRAAMEAVAFGFRQHVDVFTERGIGLGRARITNGGSRSLLWKQIIASVLDQPLEPVSDHPGASLGAALVAAIGCALLPNWHAGGAFAVHEPPVEPEPGLKALYDDTYQLYRSVAAALTPISHQIAARPDTTQ